MLVLKRKPGEEILIGDDISVKFLSRNGNIMIVGITAPRNVPIDRREIRERKRKNGQL